jgi:hypothetical protein
MRDLLKTAFNFYRQHNKRDSSSGRLTLHFAWTALEYARKDVLNYDAAMAAGDTAKAARLRHYSSSPWRKPVTNRMTAERAMWIEKPADMGLRFVGYCDELRRGIDHTGWYSDHFQDSKIRGTVYQLPGRDGKARFLAGHDDEDNGAADSGGPAYVDFSEIFESDFESEMRDALRTIGKAYQSAAMHKAGYWAEAAHETARKEAARAADGFAERQAESEREYSTAWQAGSQYSDTLDEIAGNRQTVLETIAAIKGTCETLRALPAVIRDRLKSSIESDLSERRDLFAKLEKLASGDADHLYFYPSDELRAAFNDGAGRRVL